MGDTGVGRCSPLRHWDVLVACPTCRTGGFSRFEARFTMASRLETVGFSGYADSTGTGDGYAAALRLGLSYSVLEAWEKCIDESGRGGVGIVESRELADQYRAPALKRLREFLCDRTRGGGLKKDLAKLDDPTFLDVAPIAAAVRHATFHGDLTPTGSGLRSRATRCFVDDLRTELMSVAQARFSDHVEQNCLGTHRGS